MLWYDLGISKYNAPPMQIDVESCTQHHSNARPPLRHRSPQIPLLIALFVHRQLTIVAEIGEVSVSWLVIYGFW